MGGKFLSPEVAVRLLELAESPYRPKAIVDLKEKIEAETRSAEFRASVTGQIDQEKVNEIVRMKCELDRLYMDWVEGKIS